VDEEQDEEDSQHVCVNEEHDFVDEQEEDVEQLDGEQEEDVEQVDVGVHDDVDVLQVEGVQDVLEDDEHVGNVQEDGVVHSVGVVQDSIMVDLQFRLRDILK
jgi:hypothetical protein